MRGARQNDRKRPVFRWRGRCEKTWKKTGQLLFKVDCANWTGFMVAFSCCTGPGRSSKMLLAENIVARSCFDSMCFSLRCESCQRARRGPIYIPQGRFLPTAAPLSRPSQLLSQSAASISGTVSSTVFPFGNHCKYCKARYYLCRIAMNVLVARHPFGAQSFSGTESQTWVWGWIYERKCKEGDKSTQLGLGKYSVLKQTQQRLPCAFT